MNRQAQSLFSSNQRVKTTRQEAKYNHGLFIIYILLGIIHGCHLSSRDRSSGSTVPLAASKQPVITHDPKEPWAGTGRQGKDMKEIISRRNSLLSLLFPLART
jgi:hypothetical protein